MISPERMRDLLARSEAGLVAKPARRFAVIGNCQARAVATVMRLLDPEAEILFVSAFGIARRFPSLGDLPVALAGCDAVFAGRFAAPFRDGGTFDDLKARTGALEIPVLVFPAFHPDLVYVGDLASRDGGRLVQSGIGDYHSALVLFAYLEGLDPAETHRLFDPEVYRRLGYLDLWESSAEGLLEAGRRAGHDLGSALLRWSRRGVFMHSTNHPKMYVAADLARACLGRIGIAPRACEAEDVVADEFIRQGVWPVYPAVAARYGLAGSELFLTQATRTRTAARSMTLAMFIDASFASYRAHGRSDLSCPRVTAWRTDPAIWAMLRAAAGR